MGMVLLGLSTELNGGLLPDTSWSRMGVRRKWVVKLAAGLKDCLLRGKLEPSRMYLGIDMRDLVSTLASIVVRFCTGYSEVK
jgi:hypothetical protein